MMIRHECLEALAKHVSQDDIVVAMYSAAFDWIEIRKSPLNYIFTGAMGLGSAHALGLAIGRPDRRVIILDGDGSLLMNLSGLVTVANVAPPNLYHFVNVNGVYEANGGHPTPGSGHVDFKGLAQSAGYPHCFAFSEQDEFENEIADVLTLKGPVFVAFDAERGQPTTFDYKLMHGQEIQDNFRAALNAK
jgi:sulfopyruvate decarboxylase subunit beta